MLSLDAYKRIEERCYKYCPTARVIIIGGGGAYRTALMRRSYPSAAIYCFEPASARLEALRSGMDALSINMVPTALGETTGYQRMNLTAHAPSNSFFIAAPGAFEQLHVGVGVETVSVVRLDDWCIQEQVAHGNVDCLYLDIQGAELLALRGAPAVLKHCRLVVVEVSFKPTYKDAPLWGDIDVYMRAEGFTCALKVAAAIAPDVYGDAWYIRKEVTA